MATHTMLLLSCFLSAQLYNADTNTAIGNELRLVNEGTGNGTEAGGAFVFVVPYATPQRLTVEIIADAGFTSTVSDRWTTVVVVGEQFMSWSSAGPVTLGALSPGAFY